MDDRCVIRSEPGYTAQRGRLLAAARPEYGLTETLLREKLERLPRVGDEAIAFELVLAGEVLGFVQAFVRREKCRAYIAALVVDRSVRRAGFGRSLLKAVCDELRAMGVLRIEVFGIPGNYRVPGVEPRFLDLVVSLESAGFQRFSVAVNLRAQLDKMKSVQQELATLEARCTPFTFRFATNDDAAPLSQFLERKFSADWQGEVAHAFSSPGPGICLAFLRDDIVGFAGHSIQNRELGFFGPMGVTPEYRGQGIGQILLLHCLEALRAAGHSSAIIPWVGPIGFYTRYVPCELDGVFWRYELDVSV